MRKSGDIGVWYIIAALLGVSLGFLSKGCGSPDVVLFEVVPRDGEYHVLVEDEGHVWKHILYSEDAVNKYLEEIGGEI